jgi:hypothetical protein
MSRKYHSCNFGLQLFDQENLNFAVKNAASICHTDAREHTIYSAFFFTVAIGNCMVKLIPPVNFCSDENIQTIFGTKLEDFLNYRIDYNSIS